MCEDHFFTLISSLFFTFPCIDLLIFITELKYKARSLRLRKNKDFHKKPTNGKLSSEEFSFFFFFFFEFWESGWQYAAHWKVVWTVMIALLHQCFHSSAVWTGREKKIWHAPPCNYHSDDFSRLESAHKGLFRSTEITSVFLVNILYFVAFVWWAPEEGPLVWSYELGHSKCSDSWNRIWDDWQSCQFLPIPFPFRNKHPNLMWSQFYKNESPCTFSTFNQFSFSLSTVSEDERKWNYHCQVLPQISCEHRQLWNLWFDPRLVGTRLRYWYFFKSLFFLVVYLQDHRLYLRKRQAAIVIQCYTRGWKVTHCVFRPR